MNQIFKFAAYGIAGCALLVGSFVTFSVLTGTPMHEMKAVGGMFPDNVEAETVEGGATDALPDPEEERRQDVRSPRAVFENAASPLGAFSIADPFSADELKEIEDRLIRKLESLKQRSDELDERERSLEAERQHLDDLYGELAKMRNIIMDQSAEAEAVAEENVAGANRLNERERAMYRHISTLFEDTDAEEAAGLMTTTYLDPKEGAQVLVHLEEERQRELLGAMDPADASAYLRALQKLKLEN